MSSLRISVAILIGLGFLAGCAAGPGARPPAAKPARKVASLHAPRKPETAKAASAAAPARTDWESFTHTTAALRAEIAARADAVKEGPVGNHAVELASLRLASSGRDLIDAGTLGGALETLQRAISLWGGNGYAYTFLAYVHHVQGRSDRAAEFLATAERYLPRDRAVRGEFDALGASIRQGTAASGT